MILLARRDGRTVGFKVGYAESRSTFYSAKGGVLPDERRHGVARALLGGDAGRGARAWATRASPSTRSRTSTPA